MKDKEINTETSFLSYLHQKFRGISPLILIFLLIFSGFALTAQENNNKDIHQNYQSAINMLQQSIQTLPEDSLIIKTELSRVKSEYKETSDSLKNYSTANAYAGFETQRLINLCYTSQSINRLKENQNKLFDHISNYYNHFTNPDSINTEIAKCIVNSYETQNIWFEDSLIMLVTDAMERHLLSLNSWNFQTSDYQDFVNTYAAQYYKRGIVSMAEPVFRHFKKYFQRKKAKFKKLDLSKDYNLNHAKLKPSGSRLSSFDKDMILIYAKNESPFELIYLIRQLRTAKKAYPETPFFILRSKKSVSDQYLFALKRNLAHSDYYIINLNKTDGSKLNRVSCCSYISKDGKVKYSVNNPVDFLEWLEKPLSEQNKARAEQLKENYKRIKKRKQRIDSLPPDSTLKFSDSIENIKINYRGYWNSKPEIKLKNYLFTKTSEKSFSDETQLSNLEIYLNKSPVYNQSFFYNNKEVEVNLTANPKFNITADFKDKLNQKWNKHSIKTDSLMQKNMGYKQIIEKYPFSQTRLISKMKSKYDKNEIIINEIIQNSDSQIRSLLSIKNKTADLKTSKPKSLIDFDDMHENFPLAEFDTIIWKSPYYKAWIDAWLNYGSKDLKEAIDLLYSSWKIIPDTAASTTGKYLWNKMNSMGKFDVMVHLDTTWLAGCSDIKNIDLKKRIEGYKRMSPGKKAPNIKWQDDGQEMNLYSIEADTIIIVFWSDECSHCKKELPKMYKNLSGKSDFEVIAVAVDKDDSSVKTGKEYMPEWHHIRAKNAWDDKLIEKYNIFGTPEMYILNNNYKIVEKAINYHHP